MDGWLVGWLDGWMVGWFDGWLVGWLAGWLVGWLDGRAGWRDYIPEDPLGGRKCSPINLLLLIL